jgi:ATP-dependent RNA helicase SUPV3L1/SUV3
VRRTPKPVETEIAAAENSVAQAIEAALAAPDEVAEAEAPVEETPLTGVVEPVVEAPAEDAAAEAAPEAPAEPQFDEVWFPAGRRPDNRRHHQPRREAKDGEQQSRPNGQRPRFDKERGPRPERQDAAAGEGRDGGRPNGKGKPRRFDNNKGKGFERPVRERREPVFDPDSPFAALAALRDRKPD